MNLASLLALSSAFAVATCSAGVIDSSLKELFAVGGARKTETVLVSFRQEIRHVIERIDSMSFSSRGEKITALTNAQQQFTSEIQEHLQNYLTRVGVKYESFWICNKMIIPNADSSLVKAIAQFPEVSKIEKEPKARLQLPVSGQGEDVSMQMAFGNSSGVARQGQTHVALGLHKIRAHMAWKTHTGKGIVVAIIDTGVRYTHETLRSGWRSSYGWLDPYRKSATPNDQHGHGTHVTATIVGRGGEIGVGVAPDALFISCRGCSTETCGTAELYNCAQWVQCPTKPDGSSRNCNMAPEIVSNSWALNGDGTVQTWFDDSIRSWRASGIITVFALGNAGPNCNTAGSPADRPNVISVGSTDISDKISSFSSRGPSPDGTIKPDIVAPGKDIYSAWHTSDTAYHTLQGTSMAAPHVSGVIALMLQKNPSLTHEQAYKIITGSTVTKTLGGGKACGGIPPTRFPNNVFGYGRLDAVNCLAAV